MKTLELVECDKCGRRDWKIYFNDFMSQQGSGCFDCDEGILRLCEIFKVYPSTKNELKSPERPVRAYHGDG